MDLALALNRLPLYAAAARSAVGRAVNRLLGADIVETYTPKQLVVIEALYRVYATRYKDEDCAALLGCNEGEDSFVLSARGDHSEAGGIGQWHQPRRAAILKNTGLDVWTCGATDQARALMAEISEQWPGGNPYRHVEAQLVAAPDMTTKMRVLVSKFEQSGAQNRDVARRTPMAQSILELIDTQGWNKPIVPTA